SWLLLGLARGGSRWLSRLHRIALQRMASALGRHPERLDADGRDLVAVLAQDLEPVAVECEDLAGLGDGLGLVDPQAGHGGWLLVGQVPIHLPIAVADGYRAVDIDRAVYLRADADVLDIVLVGNLADDLLQDVLQRNQALHLAVLVDHERQLGL